VFWLFNKGNDITLPFKKLGMERVKSISFKLCCKSAGTLYVTTAELSFFIGLSAAKTNIIMLLQTITPCIYYYRLPLPPKSPFILSASGSIGQLNRTVGHCRPNTAPTVKTSTAVGPLASSDSKVTSEGKGKGKVVPMLN
jgi:hypothetical protein